MSSPIQRLHCLTSSLTSLSHAEQAERLCSAGARWIQLRVKGLDLLPWIHVAQQVKSICRSHGAVLIVNDSIEVALASEADGVHLGQGDGSPLEARNRLGAAAIIGVTIHNLEEAHQAAASDLIDYWGIGPFGTSSTKADCLPSLQPVDLNALLSFAGGIPAVVIGGVGPSDVSELIERGAYGVAVCSSLFDGGEIEANCKGMLTACAKAMEEAA